MEYRPKILRVWGRADNLELEFTNDGGALWSCNVPPDMEDGEYAVEIWAINEQMEKTFWTGFLYMCNGVCHIKFNFPKYIFWFSTNYDILIERGCPHYG